MPNTRRAAVPAEKRIGTELGRWTLDAIERRPCPKRGWLIPYAQCTCRCGTKATVLLSSIVKGDSVSCGCYARETTSRVRTTHGMRSHPLYDVWNNMLQRCSNQGHRSHHRYGGRGIYVSARWHTFANFYADMGERPTDAHSIDRINNNGPYAWWNCRWATSSEQGHNMSTNRWIAHDGETLILTDWARRLGINPGRLHGAMEKYGEGEAIGRFLSDNLGPECRKKEKARGSK